MLNYLYSRFRTIAALAVITIIFLWVFTLYNVPADAVGYGALIAAAVGLAAAIVDFAGYRRRHKRMRGLPDEITITLENLPKARDRVEKDYEQLIMKLFEDRRELENAMLRKESDMTEYYTMWVHQIKTPIAAMRLLLQGMDTAEGRELSEELQRIEQYVEMVLCYLRLDSDSTDYIIRRCDLDEIVRQAVRKYSAQFIRKKIRLDYEPLEYSVLTDEKWLLFVIEQVISNSLKYTRSGSVRVYLDGEDLCIRDTGIGIAQEDLPRVFEKGYTGCNGRTDKKASGIGLYLCRRICAALGHDIIARSDETGTEIRIGLQREKIDTRD
ncbi:MAG: sensor histidine kinase [Oscillospiraceae bacterium]|nr:sensor histidine kinase [Oscillospiraceae bacterium]